MTPTLDPLTRLRNTYARVDRDYALARTMVKAAQEPLPTLSCACTITMALRQAAAVPQAWWHVQPLPEQGGIVLTYGSVAGPATPAGAAFPLFMRCLFARYAEESLGKQLGQVNKALLNQEWDDPPVVTAGGIILDTVTRELAVARAAVPATIVLPRQGAATALVTFGPLLGVIEAEYEEQQAEVQQGTRIVFAIADADETDRLLGLAEWYRELSGQAFADAILADLAPMESTDCAVFVVVVL